MSESAAGRDEVEAVAESLWISAGAVYGWDRVDEEVSERYCFRARAAIAALDAVRSSAGPDTDGGSHG